MSWQEDLQQLDAELAAGRIDQHEHRRRRDDLLAEASSGAPTYPATPARWQSTNPGRASRPGAEQSAPRPAAPVVPDAAALLRTDRPTTAPSPADAKQTDAMAHPSAAITAQHTVPSGPIVAGASWPATVTHPGPRDFLAAQQETTPTPTTWQHPREPRQATATRPAVVPGPQADPGAAAPQPGAQQNTATYPSPAGQWATGRPAQPHDPARQPTTPGPGAPGPARAIPASPVPGDNTAAQPVPAPAPQAAPHQVTADQAAAHQTAAPRAAHQTAPFQTAQQAAPEPETDQHETGARQEPPEQAASRQTAPRQAASQQTEPGSAAARSTAPPRPAPQAAPQRTNASPTPDVRPPPAPQRTTLQHAPHQPPTPQWQPPQPAAPNQPAQQPTAPHQAVPHQTAPHQAVPHQTAPHQTATQQADAAATTGQFPAEHPIPEPRTRRKPTWMFVSLGLLVVLGAIIGGAWWLGGNSNQPTAEPAGQAAPAPPQLALEERLPPLPGQPTKDSSTMSVERGAELGLYSPEAGAMFAEQGATEVIYRGSGDGPDGYLVLVVPMADRQNAATVVDYLERTALASGLTSTPVAGGTGVTGRNDTGQLSGSWYVSDEKVVSVWVSQPLDADETTLTPRLEQTIAALREPLPAR